VQNQQHILQLLKEIPLQPGRVTHIFCFQKLIFKMLLQNQQITVADPRFDLRGARGHFQGGWGVGVEHHLKVEVKVIFGVFGPNFY